LGRIYTGCDDSPFHGTLYDLNTTRMTALTAARDAEIETVPAGGGDRATAGTIRGVAETSAAVFSAELFGTRPFQNGRQFGAVIGLVPVPTQGLAVDSLFQAAQENERARRPLGRME
jgi:transposase